MSTEARKILQEEGRGSIADQSYVGALIQKWRPLLEGLPDRTEHDRYVLGCTAMLMENESRYLQNLTEDTRTINVGSFTKFIFPVLRRVFPNLIANEIVSVQPMTAPVGAVFLPKQSVTSSDDLSSISIRLPSGMAGSRLEVGAAT